MDLFDKIDELSQELLTLIFDIVNEKKLQDIDYIRISLLGLISNSTKILKETYNDSKQSIENYKPMINEGKDFLKSLSKLKINEEILKEFEKDGYNVNDLKEGFKAYKKILKNAIGDEKNGK